MKPFNKTPGWKITFPAVILMILPPLLGFSYMWFGIIYAGGLRSVVYDLSWLSFGFLFVAFSNYSKPSMSDIVKDLPRLYLGVFLIFLCGWVYTTSFVAISPKMAYYTSGRGLVALLVGLSAASLKVRYGDRFVTSISWALFAGAIFHAPFLVWIYLLEGNNPDFEWLLSLPGYPGLRMYNHAIEAGLAAGLGLYFLTATLEYTKRVALIIGITTLWILLFWGGARGAFLSLLAAFLLISVCIPQFYKQMRKAFLSTMVLGATLSLFLPIPHSAYGILSRVTKTVKSVSLDGAAVAASEPRIELWQSAFDIFKEKPLFGHGLVQYRHLVEKLAPNTEEHVHNILLEALISFGLTGTMALIYLIGKILLTSAQHLRNRTSDSDIPMFYVATTLLAHGFLSGTYFHMHSMITIAISLGVLLHYQSKSHAVPM